MKPRDFKIEEALAKDDINNVINIINTKYRGYLASAIKPYIHQPELIQDVIQLTLIKILRKYKLFNPEKASFRTWIYNVSKNTAIDIMRSNTSLLLRNTYHADISELYDIGYISIKPEHLDIVDNLNKLTDKNKDVLHSMFFLGMTQRETSEYLKVPLGTVKSRYKIGIREMRKIYRPNYG